MQQYPMETPGRALIDEMTAHAATVRECFQYGEMNYTRFYSTPGAHYHARQCIDAAEAAQQQAAALWQAAADERHHYENAHWHNGAAYVDDTIRAMRAMSRAAAITATLILWAIQARVSWRIAAPALDEPID